MMRDLIIALGLAPSGPGVRGAVDTTGGAGGGGLPYRRGLAPSGPSLRWRFVGRAGAWGERGGGAGRIIVLDDPGGAFAVRWVLALLGWADANVFGGRGGCCARRVFCLGWGEVGASADGRARSLAGFSITQVWKAPAAMAFALRPPPRSTGGKLSPISLLPWPMCRSVLPRPSCLWSL